MANSEAWLAGSARIEPVHFLLASLMIIDGLFDAAAEALDCTQESISSVFKIASECRSKMKMTDDEITSARRGIRKALGEGKGAQDIGLLHRTAESRFMFQRAARRARTDGASELTLFYLFLEMLDNLPAEARPFFRQQIGEVGASADEWPDYIGGVS